MGNKIPSKFDLKLGDIINLPDLGGDFLSSSTAEVIGIDRYTERTAEGSVNMWVSYTIETNDGQRIWAVDGQAPKKGGEAHLARSFYIPSRNNEPPEGFEFARHLSGYVELRTEGDSDLSGGSDLDIGSLFTYLSEDGQVWAEETFKGADRITFRAVFEAEDFALISG